jgi:hypothetical protein
MTSTFGTLLLGEVQSPWTLVIIAIVSALIGMFSHWFKKEYKDNIGVGVVNYFFILNLKATVFATLGMISGLFAAFAPLDYTTVSTYQVLVQSFTIGYAADSLINSTSSSSTSTDTAIVSKENT